MKQLTELERLDVAMSILDERQVNEYVIRCNELEQDCERNELEQDCERNDFHNVPAELRKLSNSIPKKIRIMLPACKPADFYKAWLETPFVDVELSKLLHFIADMTE